MPNSKLDAHAQIKQALKVNFEKINENATEPTRGSDGAAGYDLYACEEDPIVVFMPGETRTVHTGIKVAIPHGYFGAIFARSGLACKHGLRPANCVGVIDEDYRGEIMVCLRNDSNQSQGMSGKERIAQIVFIPYGTVTFNQVSSLDETARGTGGFGSTGRF